MRFNSAFAIFRCIYASLSSERVRFALERRETNSLALDAESMPDGMIKPAPPSALSILWCVWYSNKFHRTKASPRLPILVKLTASIVKTRLFRPIAWNSRTAERTMSALGYNKLLKFRTQEAYLVGNFSAAYIPALIRSIFQVFRLCRS